MRTPLSHIFEVSTCPSKKQLQEYLSGVMLREEQYAFEHHINSCLLCSEALESFMDNTSTALSSLNSSNNEFLKDHLELHPPQIYLNSVTATATASNEGKAHKTTSSRRGFLKTTSIAAALFILFGIGWYFHVQTQAPNTHSLAAVSSKTTAQKEHSSANENAAPPTASTQPQQVLEKKKRTAASLPLATSPVPAVQKTPLASTDEPKVVKNTPDAATKMTAQEESATDQTAQPKLLRAKTGVANNATSNKLSETSEEAENFTPTDALKKNNEAAMEQAQYYFDKGNYHRALAIYSKQISNSEKNSSQQAQFMAAKCHLELGHKEEAIQLLTQLVEKEHGVFKRKAKRLLREINHERKATTED